MPTIFQGEVFADYHQVYLADAVQTPLLPEEMSHDILLKRLNTVDRLLVIFTARNMTVPVEIVLHQARPDLDLGDVDHAVEASLRVPSGEILIAGCTDAIDGATRIAVPAGDLRALVLFRGLGTLSEDGLDGDDFYSVHLWPEANARVIVRRQWHGA